MAKKKELGWIWTSLVFGGIILLCYLFVATNNLFQVVYTQYHQNPGWEAIPAGISVSASAVLKWGAVAKGLKTIGWIVLCLTPVTNFIAWKWDYKLSTEGTPWLKLILTVGVPAIAGILWLCTFFNKLEFNKWNGTFDKFVNEFSISESQASKIQLEGGSGALEIKDENGKLTEWFKQNIK